MYKYYNPNPANERVGDCTVRAITKATGLDWEEVYIGLSCMGYCLSDMPSANHVWGSYLRNKGFKRFIVEDNGNDNYCVADFCRDNPRGVYVLALQGHVVAVKDGDYYDSWDSGREPCIYYWRKV